MLHMNAVAAGLSALLLIHPAVAVPKSGGKQPPAARVVEVEGKVLVSRGKTTRMLSVNDPVRPGDEIESGLKGHVKILWPNQAAVFVKPFSKVKVSVTHGTPDLRVERGGVLSYVKPGAFADSRRSPKKGGDRRRFAVRTRSAVMGVRGTAFYVTNPMKKEDPAYFCPCHGKILVEISAGKSKPLRKSFDSRSHDDPHHLSSTGIFASVPGDTPPGHTEEEIEALKGLVK